MVQIIVPLEQLEQAALAAVGMVAKRVVEHLALLIPEEVAAAEVMMDHLLALAALEVLVLWFFPIWFQQQPTSQSSLLLVHGKLQPVLPLLTIWLWLGVAVVDQQKVLVVELVDLELVLAYLSLLEPPTLLLLVQVGMAAQQELK